MYFPVQIIIEQRHRDNHIVVFTQILASSYCYMDRSAHHFLFSHY